MIRQKFIRKGRFSGKMCEFTHYNPADGKIWSDDIEVVETFIDEKTGQKKKRKTFGKWVDSEGVVWSD